MVASLSNIALKVGQAGRTALGAGKIEVAPFGSCELGETEMRAHRKPSGTSDQGYAGED